VETNENWLELVKGLRVSLDGIGEVLQGLALASMCGQFDPMTGQHVIDLNSDVRQLSQTIDRVLSVNA